MSANEAPLLRWQALRVDVDHRPRFEGTRGESQGDRLLVLGADRALFQAVAGELDVTSGHLSVRGLAPLAARTAGVLAAVRFDLPLPARWKALEYVGWSARLTGLARGDALDLAQGALRQLGLAETTRLGALDEVERARLQIAAALATDPDVVAIDDPFAGRTDASAAAVETALLDALVDRAWMVFAQRAPLASRLASAAEQVMILGGAEVLAEGTAAELAAHARSYVARLAPVEATDATAETDREGATGTEAFARSAAELGIEVALRGERVRIQLPENVGTSALFSLASAAHLAIVELRPLAGPLA